MSAAYKVGGRAPSQRRHVARQRKSLRLDLQMKSYTKLRMMAAVGSDGRPEPIVAVIERLIAYAELPAATN